MSPASPSCWCGECATHRPSAHHTQTSAETFIKQNAARALCKAATVSLPFLALAVSTAYDWLWPQVMETLQAPSRALLGALTALFSPKFLLSKETRAGVLQWIATALRCDTERTKMHVSDAKATSDGFMHNLNRVLLHLCGPFTDFYSGKAKQFINLECAFLSEPHACDVLAPAFS